MIANMTSNNKSRPDQPLNSFVFIDHDDDYKLSPKNSPTRKRRSVTFLTHNKIKKTSTRSRKSKSKPRRTRANKYSKNDRVLLSKGQKAVIKFIGQCHKGPGMWYGIEYIDGTLGKHNGTIGGNVYFIGAPRRCDMIRRNIIRRKITIPFTNTNNRSMRQNNRIKLNKTHKRANSDLSELSICDLSLINNLSDNINRKKYKKSKKKRTRTKHKRVTSQPTRLNFFNYKKSFENNEKDKKERELMLFGAKYNRKYVKKEKYKGNKYILAKEVEKEKKRNKLINSIKINKKKIIKKTKDRINNKNEKIKLFKEIKKKNINKLNEEYKKLNDKRILLAKRKSKKRLNVNAIIRTRSTSDIGKSNLTGNINKNVFNTPDINKLSRARSVKLMKNMPKIPNIKPLVYSNSSDVKPNKISIISVISPRLQTSTTPLADDFHIDDHMTVTPIPDDFPNTAVGMDIPDCVVFDDDNKLDENDMDSDDQDDINSVNKDNSVSLLRSFSDDVVTMNSSSMVIRTPYKQRKHKMDKMIPINSDSALILKELLDYPISELISSADESLSPSISPCPSPSLTLNSPINSRTHKKYKKKSPKTNNNSLTQLKENTNDNFFNFPMMHGTKPRSYSHEDIHNNTNKSLQSIPILNADNKGTDYWIKQYNKMNNQVDAVNKTCTKNQTIIKENQADDIDVNDIKTDIIKPTDTDTDNKNDNNDKNVTNNADKDELYCPINRGGSLRQRSVSLSGAKEMKIKQISTSTIIASDDKGTDYWIKQYEKANKRKKTKQRSSTPSPSSKKKSKSKSISTKKKSLSNSPPKSKSKSKSKFKKKLSIVAKTDRKRLSKSKSIGFSIDDLMCLRDNVSSPSPIRDNMSVLSSLSYDTRSVDCITITSNVSSLSPSPNTSSNTSANTSANSTPKNANDIINDIEMNKALTAASIQSKYGVYPFPRTRQQYINKKFTGICRIGHRYLLRDGRIGVVRYINQTRFAPGTWIGFELDKAEGEHNGTVCGIKYFNCGKMYATFVKKNQIAQCIGRDNTKSLSREQLRKMNKSK